MAFAVRLFVIALVCSVPLFLCAGVLAADVLRYAGATTLQRDFMLDASSRFGAANNVKFAIEGGNSGAGIKALSDGAIDLAGSGRFLTKQEKAAGLVEHRLGWDPLVVVVHATNSIENISREDLQRMLLGSVRNWSQVGGRDLPVLQVAAPQGSGVRDAVENLLLDDQHLSPQAIVSLVVADADRNVALLPAAFTVTSMSMVDVDKVKVIKVDGVFPNRQTISAGAYPLIKPLLLVTKGTPQGKLALFVNFAKGPEGQAIIVKKFFPMTYK